MPLTDISGSVLGVTLLKLNGIFDLDVKNVRWSVRVPVPQHDTGLGVRNARGLEHPTLTFEVVAVRANAFDYRSLRQFSAEVYDKETRKVVVFAAEGFDWNELGGSSDVGSAMTGKTLSCVGTGVVKA